jgi:FtsP/CotA-like multicopper oxidase with cupredoxin domain
MPEYVHWHGLKVPPEVDGTEEEDSLVVPAHGELRYSLTPTPSGTRYVHSHAMSGMKSLDGGTYSGQFGFVYVEPKRHAGRYDQEIFLATHEWGPELLWQAEGADLDELSSRGRRSQPEGNWEVEYDIGSINGKALGHGEPVRVKPGQRVLFHLLNASATAPVQLAMAGHKFLVVAMDGNPVPSPQWTEAIMLDTAERVDAIVEMNNPGVWVLGAVDDDDREVGGMGVIVEYAGKSGPPRWIPPSNLGWDYSIFGGPASQNTVGSIFPMVIDRIAPTLNRMEQWTINGKDWDPSNPTVLQSGTRYRLAFQNRTGDDHPLHLHRYPLELKSVNGKRTTGIVKDVAVLRARAKLELDFTPDHPGLALLHCHQQMHMDNGFKTLLKIV